jgi:hypothetical protein
MKVIVFPMVALILAVPAIAQQPPADSKMDAAPPAAAAAPAPAPADPATILKNEFPAYDKDGSGELSKEEFSSWLTALRNAAPQKTELTADQEGQWLTKSFGEADSDKNQTINLIELTAYLTRKS